MARPLPGEASATAQPTLAARWICTFCLRSLDFGPPPDKAFVRAKAKLGDLSMGFEIGAGPIDMDTIVFLRNGSVVCASRRRSRSIKFVLYAASRRPRRRARTTASICSTSKRARSSSTCQERGNAAGHVPSPDNRYILTANIDQIMRVWNVETGKLVVRSSWPATTSGSPGPPRATTLRRSPVSG